MCKFIKRKTYVIIWLTILFLLLSNITIFSKKSYATYTDSYGVEHLSAGETGEIDYEPLYSATYETEDRSDWSSGSTQKQINDLWTSQGKTMDAHGWAYVTIGGQPYYLIATGQYFGVEGDYLIITLENGNSYPCIMGDAKAKDDKTSELYSYCDSEGRYLGHMYTTGGEEKLNVLELMLGTHDAWVANAEGEELTLNELGQVAKILNGGNYEEYPDGPVGANGIVYTLTAGTESSTSEFVENFKKNPIGTIISLILDGLRTLGDGVQMIIDCIQNSTLHIGINLMYTYEDLKDDVGPENKNNGAGNKNAYTNVSGYVSGGNSATDLNSGQIGIDVTESYFNAETEIPVVTVDYYDFAVNDINFLDINYLTGEKDHDDGSPWTIIRNFAAAFIRMTLYISAILLITMLIVHGINIAQYSIIGLENPKKRLDTKKGMDKFITAVCMLVGTVVISSLCIFGTDALCQMIAVDSVGSSGGTSFSEYESPIRVHVASAGYSFSTSFTGYARYMTQIDDVDQFAQKAMYTFVYLMFVILNVIGLVFMLFRLFALYVLAIYGPITVVMYMFSKETELGKVPNNYKNWAMMYGLLCATQLIFAISYRAVISWIVS